MKVVFDINKQDKFKDRVVAYMRYSSENQSEHSIEYQREYIDKYISENNWVKAAEYIDLARTGTNDQRQSFQEMIFDAQNKPCWDKVLVYDFSRFSRNMADAMKYSALLKDYDISLISVTQPLGNDKNGRLLFGITNLINDYFSSNLADVPFDSLKTKAEDGITCGGKPPLGYDFDHSGKLVINPDEAKCVQLIFDLYENNYSYNCMADELNKRGYKTKFGNKFNKNSFSSILNQEKYTGKYIWNKTSKKSSKGTRNSHKYKSEAEYVIREDIVPVIISKDQFDRVQAMMRDRQGGTAQSKARRFYLLSSMGKLKCAKCGANLVGTARKSHGIEYTYYYCPNKKRHQCTTKEIRADYLDYFVVNSLMAYVYKHIDIIDIYNNLDERKRIRELKNKLLGLNKAKKNILNSIRKSYDSDLVAELQNVKKETQVFQDELDMLTKDQIMLSNADKKKLCQKIRKMILNTDSFEVKKYLNYMIDEIVVSNDNIDIQLNIA